MEKLDSKTDGASQDIVADNIDKLRELFPDAFTESSDADGPRWKVDFDALKACLGEYVEDERERYSFTWNGKARARRIAQTPSTGTLRPCPEESVNWDTTQNLFIEGDNLEVLKLLQKPYHKQVKMIYIDPPYNTGGEFIYPDRFQDNLDTYLRYTGQVDGNGFKTSSNSESAGRYHTNWLNMMYPRLRLARNLLKDDGVIFVSIDDHEVQNLRQIMDDIFGPENFIATAIWQKVYAPKSSARHFSEDHDYIMIYARSHDEWMPELLPRTEEQNSVYKNPDDDPRGRWRPNNLAARNYYSKGSYPITCPSGRVIEGPPSGSYWRISKEKLIDLDNDNRIYWGKDGNNVPAPKIFLSEVRQGRVPQTLWSYSEVGHTQKAKRELLERLKFQSSETVFDTPKPTNLIKQMLRIGTKSGEQAIVLDFFAGSATLGDATMQLNAEDEGDRRYILVQLPEQTDAEDYATIADMGKARLRAAMESIGKDDDKPHATTTDLGFKAFKLSDSNIVPWAPGTDDLKTSLFDSVDNIRHDRSEADVLSELLLKYGLDLAVPIEERDINGKTVHIIGAGALVVCLADAVDLELVNGIAALKTELTPEVMRVVFKDNGFANDVVKTNAVQILRQAGVEDVKSL
ncbi:trans-aconitate 2-methyltransferase protein [Salinisphaera shabanensis E1L3A]|uniref:site-specific DNA-methyltransferase (adenine-specific) n=1 Tax=Salinisphaera shabanensis E1L3A TaxID=1033802 RepID=U2E851_9GAMM|nr:site-specific DNA-methyltransferase [Salinisphaera shabanensis]ERJ19906.1 trans-aconitate 2-methyltransferase protein [Salinisphaera shabanensis E1L3A]